MLFRKDIPLQNSYIVGHWRICDLFIICLSAGLRVRYIMVTLLQYNLHQRPDMLQINYLHYKRLSPKIQIFLVFLFSSLFIGFCWTLARSLQGHFPDLYLSLSILIFLYHQNQSILQTHHHFHLPHVTASPLVLNWDIWTKPSLDKEVHSAKIYNFYNAFISPTSGYQRFDVF